MLSFSLSSPPIPGRYLCSITSQIMAEPVITADGHTYEREAIEAWLRENDTSPKTGRVLKHKELTPNWDKVSDLGEFLAENPALKGSAELYLPKTWVRALVCDLKANALSAVRGWFSKDRRLLTQPLESSYTAFHLAADFGSPELLEMVCEQLEAQGCLEAIALKPSLMAHAVKTTTSLHKSSIQTFEMPLKSKVLSPQGFRGRHLNTLLERALEQGDELKAAQWLRLGAELEQPALGSGNSLLARCVCKGQVAAVKWLLAQGASVSSCNFEGNTPLHLSVIHDCLPITNFLLGMKAEMKLENAQGQSALHLAILGQSTRMMAAFVGAEQAALSPYHIALLQDDQRLMKALLEQEVFGIDAFDAQGHTLLWIASERGDVNLVQCLLAQGAELECICGTEQERALHIAAKQGHQAVVALLITSKAEIEATDLKGNTALHLAAQAGSEAVSHCLLEAGAYHKARNHENQTPMELGRQYHHLQVANFIEKKARALKQAKLEVINRLHQVTEDQSIRILQLEQRIERESTKHEKERLGLENKIVLLEEALKQRLNTLDEVVTELQPKVPEPLMFSSSNTLKLSPTLRVTSAELSVFLRFVVEGEQEQAETMLERNRDLVLFAGDVTDLSKRSFEGITGLQYAIWALDTHMWRMLLNYVTADEATCQLQKMGSWVSTYGLHVGLPGGPLHNLSAALKNCIDNSQGWSTEQWIEGWCKQVGGAQLLLPAHVINEYCREDRSFNPCPSFTESTLPRTRKIGNCKWFSTSDKGRLGYDCAVLRKAELSLERSETWAEEWVDYRKQSDSFSKAQEADKEKVLQRALYERRLVHYEKLRKYEFDLYQKDQECWNQGRAAPARPSGNTRIDESLEYLGYSKYAGSRNPDICRDGEKEKLLLKALGQPPVPPNRPKFSSQFRIDYVAVTRLTAVRVQELSKQATLLGIEQYVNGGLKADENDRSSKGIKANSMTAFLKRYKS